LLQLGVNTSEALKQLNLLTLSPNKRRQILRGAGRKVRRSSRDRIKAQKDLNGKTWQGRSNGRKKKMLKKLGKHIQVRTTANKVDVTFSGNNIGRIARAHQEGVSQTMTAKDAQKRYGTPDYKAPATRKQAKALRANGYKIRKSRGKGWKNPSLKWITQNLNSGQAGLILRILKGNQKGKSSWQLPLPKRSFLGQSQTEYKQLKNFMLDEAIRLS